MKINKEEARKKFDREYPNHQKDKRYESNRMLYLTLKNVQKIKDMYYQHTYNQMSHELGIGTTEVATIVSYLIKKGFINKKNKEKFSDKMDKILKQLK